MIRALADKGGLAAVNFGSAERGPEAAEFWRRIYAEHSIEWASIERVADHIDPIVELVGIDYVGLGSDFGRRRDSLPMGLRVWPSIRSGSG